MTEQGNYVGLAVAGGAMLGVLLTILLMPKPLPEPAKTVTVPGPERVVTVTGPRVEVPVEVVRVVTRDAVPTPQATDCVVMRWRKE